MTWFSVIVCAVERYRCTELRCCGRPASESENFSGKSCLTQFHLLLFSLYVFSVFFSYFATKLLKNQEFTRMEFSVWRQWLLCCSRETVLRKYWKCVIENH